MVLKKTGVKLTEKERSIRTEFEKPSVPGIYALGDVSLVNDLTPVAVKAGRQLSKRLATIKAMLSDYTDVTTVVFNTIIKAVGLTERKKQSLNTVQKNIKVYKSSFTPYIQPNRRQSSSAMK